MVQRQIICHMCTTDPRYFMSATLNFESLILMLAAIYWQD